jgi:hypothetical protein
MFQNQTANCSYQFEFKFEFWYLNIFSNMWKIKYFCIRFFRLEYVHYCDFLLIPKNIFSYAQYVTVQEYFSHPSSVFYFLPTPPIKLRLQLSGRLLIANHLDQSLWLANQKQGATVRSYLFSSSGRCYALLCLMPASAYCAKLLQNQSAEPSYFDFSSSNFNLQGHILSTSGVAHRPSLWRLEGLRGVRN